MTTKTIPEKTIKEEIRDKYGSIARTAGSCCGSSPASDASKKVGYSDDDISAVPGGANLGLGCGNPVAIASLQPGETVLDLGSGGGFDAFLAAKKVGPSGRVIGVDMTPDMIERARANAKAGGYANVDFRLGEIEALPVEDNSVDVIISNCVINLALDKSRVFSEALRVLKPGGRFMVSDTVMTRPLPEPIQKSVAAYMGCISGALMKEEYLSMLRAAGFAKADIVKNSPIDFGSAIKSLGFQVDIPPAELAGIIGILDISITSITVSAVKKNVRQ
jgi:SAM-dependent methyltransferase